MRSPRCSSRSRRSSSRRSPKRLAQRGAADVAFEDVVFGYEPRRPVLDGFSLEIPRAAPWHSSAAPAPARRRRAALLARFYDPQFGRVVVGGVDVRELRVDDLRHTVGIVFEDTFLFTDTVAANIAFARPDASRREIESAARLGGAHEFVSALPLGYDTVLGERGYSLSGASASGSRSRARSSPIPRC